MAPAPMPTTPYGGLGLDEWTNNIFQENDAYYDGGGFYADTNYYQEFVNNTVVGNSAGTNGGGVYWATSHGYYGGSFVNNIVAYTASGDGLYADSTSASYTSIQYNDWYTNTATDASGSLTSSDISGRGNTTADPAFDDYSLDGDCTNDTLTLSTGSSLVDAGHPDISDADGRASDIGLYGGPDAPSPEADADTDTDADADGDTATDSDTDGDGDGDTDGGPAEPVHTGEDDGDDDDKGCGCTSEPSTPGTLAWSVLGLGLAWMRRRRRPD